MEAEYVKNWIRRIETGQSMPMTSGEAQSMFDDLGNGFSYAVHSNGLKGNFAAFVSKPDAAMGEWKGEGETAAHAMAIAILKAYLYVNHNEVYMKDSLI